MIGLIWLSCIMQPQYIRGLLSNGFSSSPGAAEQTPSIGSQIMQWLFNSILPAIAIYTITAHTAIYGSALFGWLVALSILSDLVRALSGLIVQYTFRFGKRASMAYLRYFSLRSLFTYVLFIIVLLITYSSVGTLWINILGIITAIFLVLVGIQWARLFCTSIIDVIGVVIYLITVELLPILLLFEAGEQLYTHYFA